ncbi:hypothetical protein LTR99_009699 [Exophiala xenobiotica]|uniref:F-box domain-containing protein n=1 Tax=Vermiconidia calcicola TaxID=1690605 RepID=A0AAV9PYV0_9PEZI|nr:hypothetical protein LTR96_007175 [Exophiala xenobiotica]KAK5530233.1 hypothetical protein LTR23_010453 [Chaetothyriales sp. CCFEE 6169]KAK5530537.1 hypothetical protein LTR25_009115 [Vermiconidia calcicola]KAK5294301.1 hypothetical protein LTR99_009699 [Exophiala xenobiotica]KAK5336194.1 hypothetical protein LTR98_007524 [Exophiala xenobiotica]
MSADSTFSNSIPWVDNDGQPVHNPAQHLHNASQVPWLPNEVLSCIIRHALGPVTRLSCPELFDRVQNLSLQNTLLDLKLTCRRFHDIVNDLLITPKTINVQLLGPVPVGDRERITEASNYYRDKLWTRLLPAIRTNRAYNVVIHIIPELHSQRATVNWEHRNYPGVLHGRKDDLTARKAMTSHLAAAFVLASIMYKILARYPQFRVSLVFYEVDESRPARALVEDEAPPKPEVLPFWDYKSICCIIYHWRWLYNFRRPGDNNVRNFFKLPTLAVAIDYTSRRPGDIWTPRQDVIGGVITPLALSQYLFDFCSNMVHQAWTTRQPLWSDATVRPAVRHYIPGFRGRSILCSEDRRFALWLTTTSLQTNPMRCFAVQRAERSASLPLNRQVAVEVNVPNGRTPLIDSWS